MALLYTINGDNAPKATHVSVVITNGEWGDSGWSTDAEKKVYQSWTLDEANGSVSFDTPADTSWNVYIVAETVSDGNATDYASAPAKVALSTASNEEEEEQENEKKNVTDDSAATIGDKSTAKTLEDLVSADEAELAKVTTLNIEDASQLTSLTGIEKLKNLTTLNIKNASSLSSLTGIEKLKYLTSLSVINCPDLETLDLSNTNLESVTVNNCGLTNLDVSGCASLDLLNCGVCSIDNLILPSGLVSLDCHGNRLVSLDVSGFAKLEYLRCENQTSDGTTTQTDNGWVLVLPDFPGDMSNGAVSLTEAAGLDVDSVEVLDKAGNPLTMETDATGVVYFNTQPATVKYNFITGHAKTKTMDVTVSLTESDSGGGDTLTANPHSGCEVGLGALALFAALPLLVVKRRR